MTNPIRKRPSRPSRYVRRVMPLSGSITRSEAALSHEADLALSYSLLWLASAGPARPSDSAVTRRALTMYATHLYTADPVDEFATVLRCSDAREVPEEDRQAALLRLYATPLGEQPVPFADIRSGPQARAEHVAFEERNAALLAHVMAEPRRTRKPPTTTPEGATT